MRVYASQLMTRAEVRDLDTGNRVKGCLWVNESAGQAEAYCFDDKGDKVLVFDVDGDAAWKTVLLTGRFKLVVLDKPPDRFAKLMGAANCGKCGSPLTLRGDELCPKCKRADIGKPVRVEPCSILDGHKCERCSRDATWSVVDEVEVSPSLGKLPAFGRCMGGAYLFDRGVTVGRRYYCSRHYVGPRLLDAKGELVSTDDGGVRPE